jgi:hypothetical protein
MHVHIARNGVEIGEWTEKQVRAFYAEGRLVKTDTYWTVGMVEWFPLSDFINPPPPFPPPPFPDEDSEAINQEPEEVEEAEEGISRLKFNCTFLGLFITAVVLQAIWGDSVAGLCIIAVAIADLFLIGYRLINIGYPFWYCFLILIPLVNIGLLLTCFFYPTGYLIKQKLKMLEEQKIT